MIDKKIRTERVRFGGGGSQDRHGGGYQGGSGAPGSAESSGGTGNGGTGNGGNGGDNRPDRTNPNNPPRSYSPPATPIQVVDTTSKKYTETPLTTMTIDPMDIKEQYKIGTKINPPNAFTSMPSVTFDQPYMAKGLENIRKDNYIDRLNLQGETYQPPNIPPFIPGSTLIKTLGSFGFDKNKDFFAQNVAGKYGYGYGLKDFEKYMSDRMAGEVGAYGNEEQGQNALNGREGGDDGIMSVYNNPNDTDVEDVEDVDGDGDVDETDKFIFRYFDESGESLQAGAGGVKDLMTRIRQRLSNIFTT